MSERVHMTAPDGRTFTFKEWCDYLDKYKDFSECYEAYVGMDGKVFEIDGFHFNVHDHCLNPHVIMVGDHEVGFELRTYRKWICLLDRRPVWWWDIYGFGMTGASGFGYVMGDEADAILAGIRKAIKGMKEREKWYEHALECWEDDGHNMGYAASLARCRRGIALAREEYDKRCQLTLF